MAGSDGARAGESSSVSIGRRLGHYEITAAIGKGGMGEVWRAKDTKLGRDVAIKVLPEEFTKDAERLARFEREARILASLEHTNIASIYGFEDAVIPSERSESRDLPSVDSTPASRDRNDTSVRFLVMQLASGEDLSERLGRGPIPVDETLKIAKQIAEALEAAHEKGVVHRDLKPANIKIGDEGQVKVLDFGLAKAMDSEEADADFSNSPTMVRAATHAGMILGTAAYMSPEQARGKRVDKRADLWAFGVVLYEMLTGRRLFSGDTVSDTLAEVLKGEVDWSLLPDGTPAAVRRLLRRCLERDRTHRLADAADARLEIEEAMRGESEGPVATAASRGVSRTMIAALAVAALVAGALCAWLVIRHRPAGSDEVLKLEITGASFNAVSTVAISPDGKRIAYAPYTASADARLKIRELDDFTSREVPGTTGAMYPFFSPDGRHVGYFTTGREMFVVSLSGGTPRKLLRVASFGENAAWLPDGRIICSGGEIDGTRWRGLAIVSSEGGAAKALTKPSPQERSHAQPVALPGGRWVLFTVVMTGGFAIDAVSLEDGSRHRVVESGSSPQYAPGGHLVFYRASDQALLAAPLDRDKAVLTADPVVIQQDVLRLSQGQGAFAIASADGTMIYTPTNTNSDLTGVFSLVWVDRNGNAGPLTDRRDSWTQPRLSPDGNTLLVRQTATPDCTLWTVDLSRGTMTRQTFDGDNHSPAWRPDGKAILTAIAGDSFRQLYSKGLGAEAAAKKLTDEKGDVADGVFSPDGKHVVYELSSTESSVDLYAMDASGAGKRPFATTPFDETTPAFSPDGRWVAYTSNESGRAEIYVKPFEGDGAKVQISTDGGVGPLWSRDGRELFFVARDRFMVVDVTPGVELRFSQPRLQFKGTYVWERPSNYDISPDGKRFVMVQPTSGEGITEVVRVTTNWSRELEKRFAK